MHLVDYISSTRASVTDTSFISVAFIMKLVRILTITRVAPLPLRKEANRINAGKLVGKFDDTKQ